MTENRGLSAGYGRLVTGLIALGLGLAVTLAVLLLIKFISNDMRWVLWLGSAGLLGAALWTGSRRRGGVLSFLLLCLPLLLVWVALVLPQLPGLWPHLVAWLGFALLGWYGFRPGHRPAAWALVALLVLGAGSFWYAMAYVPGAISRSLSQYRNDPAPEFSLVHLDGRPYPMESLQGKVLILDFFATWCAPCIAELPEIDAVYQRYAAESDVEILVLASDPGDTPEAIREFVAGRALQVPFLYDTEGRAHKAFGFAGFPGLAVIDKTARLRFTREGYNAAEHDFQDQLVEMIESFR